MLVSRFRLPKSLAPVLAVLAVILVAAPAAAVTFSFASDDNHDGPTWQGNSGGSMPDDLSDAAPYDLSAAVEVDLVVDTNGDAAGGLVTFQSVVTFGGSISGVTFTARGGGYLNVWDVTDGALHFSQQGTGAPILTIYFDQAVLSTYSPNFFNLGQTATLQTNSDVDPGLFFVTHPLLQGVGVTNSKVSTSEDFALTFTNLRKPDGSPGIIHHGVFLGDWIAEGSFSAHAAGKKIAEEEPLPDDEIR